MERSINYEFKNGPYENGPQKKNIPPWLAKLKIFTPGLIQMLLLDLLLLLLLYVFTT